MWVDQHGVQIRDGDQYAASDGTQYPGSFPRNEIPGLTEVPDEPQEPPTTDEIQAQIVGLTQRRLDLFAQTRGYDSILSAASYAGDSNLRLAKEGDYAKLMRSQTWETLYGLLAEVEAGTRLMAAGFEDVESLLPTLEWPT